MIRNYFQKPLSFFMGHSIFLHLSIVGVFLILTKILNISFEQKLKANLALVESSVRIDVVAMPKLTVKELKKINTADIPKAKVGGSPEKKEAPKTENKSKIEFKKEGPKPLSFAERMKLLSQKNAKKTVVKKKSNTQNKNNENAEDNQEISKALRDLVLAGNKVSKGTSVLGVGAGGVSGPFMEYLGGLPDHIRPHWKLPSYLLDKDLKCRIRIFLGPGGKLLKAQIYESSGMEEYDQRALEAVKKSSPFPNPSKEFLSKATRGDIVLGFPL